MISAGCASSRVDCRSIRTEKYAMKRIMAASTATTAFQTVFFTFATYCNSNGEVRNDRWGSLTDLGESALGERSRSRLCKRLKTRRVRNRALSAGNMSRSHECERCTHECA